VQALRSRRTEAASDGNGASVALDEGDRSTKALAAVVNTLRMRRAEAAQAMVTAKVLEAAEDATAAGTELIEADAVDATSKGHETAQVVWRWWEEDEAELEAEPKAAISPEAGVDLATHEQKRSSLMRTAQLEEQPSSMQEVAPESGEVRTAGMNGEKRPSKSGEVRMASVDGEKSSSKRGKGKKRKRRGKK